MTNEQREIHRKKRVLEHAERIGNVNKTCRYFGVARSTFYLWRARYRELGDQGLKSRRCCAHDHPNKTPDERVWLGPGQIPPKQEGERKPSRMGEYAGVMTIRELADLVTFLNKSAN